MHPMTAQILAQTKATPLAERSEVSHGPTGQGHTANTPGAAASSHIPASSHTREAIAQAHRQRQHLRAEHTVAEIAGRAEHSPKGHSPFQVQASSRGMGMAALATVMEVAGSSR